MSPTESRWIALQRRAGERLSDGVARTITHAITTGALRPGVSLPSSRELATQLRVSRGVVSEAYEQLAAQGHLVARVKAPPLVADVKPGSSDRSQPSVPKSAATRFDFTPTAPDLRQFPVRRWTAAVTRAASLIPVADYDYGDPRGSNRLRRVLAAHLGRTRGVITDPEHIVLVNGVSQGLNLLFGILAQADTVDVAVEDPSLMTQVERLRSHRLQPVGIPVDEFGICVDKLDASVAAAIVTPAHQFPMGVVLSGERRRQLLEHSRSNDMMIIEDDYDAEFRYDRQPVRAIQGLDPAQVAYLGTTSKTLAPALRIGWLVAPDRYVEPLLRARRLIDVCPSVLDHYALALLMERGDYDRHVRRARLVYRRRREHLQDALAARIPAMRMEGVAAGVHAVLRLPADAPAAEVERVGAERGLELRSLARYSLTARVPNAIVIGYGRLPDRSIADAVAALAAVVESVRARPFRTAKQR